MHAKGSRNKKELTWKSEKQEKKTKMDRVSGHNWSDIGLNEATQQTVKTFSVCQLTKQYCKIKSYGIYSVFCIVSDIAMAACSKFSHQYGNANSVFLSSPIYIFCFVILFFLYFKVPLVFLDVRCFLFSVITKLSPSWSSHIWHGYSKFIKRFCSWTHLLPREYILYFVHGFMMWLIGFRTSFNG